eukprot:858577-Prorocentrum_minimum.AAC.1
MFPNPNPNPNPIPNPIPIPNPTLTLTLTPTLTLTLTLTLRGRRCWQVRGVGALANENTSPLVTCTCSWAGGLKMKRASMPLSGILAEHAARAR